MWFRLAEVACELTRDFTRTGMLVRSVQKSITFTIKVRGKQHLVRKIRGKLTEGRINSLFFVFCFSLLEGTHRMRMLAMIDALS